MAQIRILAHELFDALTKERTVDAQTGFELGRLSAALTMLTGGPPVRDPTLRTRASDREVHTQAPAQGANGTGGHSNGAAAPAQPQKRIRIERRPMRHAERTLTGPNGRVVTYNFERFEIRDSAGKTEVVGGRKELWDRLKKQKKEFKKLAAKM